MAIAALIVSIVAALAAALSFWASWRSANAARHSAAEAGRSADASEAMERRERQPTLAISMVSPAASASDRVIYAIRNDGPQDLENLTIYRPRPPDGIRYPIAVPGNPDGWAEDEITLGSLKLAEETRFTLCCGNALILPEFRVRITCEAGKDSWTLAPELPNPRMTPLSPEERASRRTLLTSALLEIEHNITTLTGAEWATLPLEEDNLRKAEQLIREHAAERSGPLRDLVQRIQSYRTWIDQHEGTFRGDEIQERRDPLVSLHSAAVPELEGLKAALQAPQASGQRWNS